MAVTVKTDVFASGSMEQEKIVRIGVTGDEDIPYLAEIRFKKDLIESCSAAVKAALGPILVGELFNAPVGNDSDASNNTEAIS